MRARRCGFTLIEMLVAITLLAILGVISWRGLDYVAAQRERIDQDAEETVRVLRVLAQLERDIAKRVPDVVMPPPATRSVLPPSITVTTDNDGAMTLEILRLAPAAQGPARAQRIVYQVSEGALVRSASLASTSLPIAPAANPVVMVPGARRLEVRVYSGGFWAQPGGGTSAQPPASATGIEIAIEFAEGARYLRVFAL